jgi:hypothetical protein
MQDRWRFLTGLLAKLKDVWSAYQACVAATHNNSGHQTVMYLIGTHGREGTI